MRSLKPGGFKFRGCAGLWREEQAAVRARARDHCGVLRLTIRGRPRRVSSMPQHLHLGSGAPVTSRAAARKAFITVVPGQVQIPGGLDNGGPGVAYPPPGVRRSRPSRTARAVASEMTGARADLLAAARWTREAEDAGCEANERRVAPLGPRPKHGGREQDPVGRPV